MASKKIIQGSQVAERNSSIANSKNQQDNSVNTIRREAAIISFIVATISSILASYIYDNLIK